MKALKVSNIGKAFKHYPTVRARLKEWIIGGRKNYHQLHWVLRDINFCINKGEAVGLVGMNGAGKSTLLKLITGVSYPTLGSITKYGTISALLELGIGFHPELTGRENIFIASQLVGLKRKDVLKLIPAIEDFAEISTFIDKPLRVYSSGMKMRLAFSIATVVQPDILIVDEALAVGDSYFQHKCYQRIREFIAKGTALIFVSHDSTAITSICDRAILLHKGRVAEEGAPELVMNNYRALLADFNIEHIRKVPHPCGKIQTISGTGEASILDIDLINEKGHPVGSIHVGEAVKLYVKIRANTFLDELTIGFEIKDKYGYPLFGTNTKYLEYPLLVLQENEIVEVMFDFFANLGGGEYSISIALHAGYEHIGKNYEWREFALIFNVINFDKPKFIGANWLPQQVICNRTIPSLLEPCVNQQHD